jgi:hypothetical protein
LNKKIYNQDMQMWYRADFRSILLELEDGKQVYIHHFEGVLSSGKRLYSFVGKNNRPHLRKCLWSLESNGLIININLGMNQHMWKITDLGKTFLNKHS